MPIFGEYSNRLLMREGGAGDRNPVLGFYEAPLKTITGTSGLETLALQ